MMGAALNRNFDINSAKRLAVQLDTHRQELEAIAENHRRALAVVPVPTWADWRRQGPVQDAERDRDPERTQQPIINQDSVRPDLNQLSPDPAAAALILAAQEHELRAERLRRNRERKASLRRGDLDARVAAIADDAVVKAAATIIWSLRSRHGVRIVVVALTALAAGSAIAPLVLAAAAAALLRRGAIQSERASIRADVDEAKAARTGFVFADIAAADRRSYAALVRSNIVDPAGPDAGPVIAAIGQQSAARFVAWFAYATPKQRGIVEGWDKPRPRHRPRARPSRPRASREL